MEKHVNLKQLEKGTAAVIFRTGIVEIGIGLVFAVSALTFLFDDLRYFISLLFVVPILFIMLANKYLVQPRMGVVNFSKSRIRKSRLVYIIITVILVILVILTFFSFAGMPEGFINPIWLITGIIFMICISIAYFMNFKRMYVFAFLLAGAFNLS